MSFRLFFGLGILFAILTAAAKIVTLQVLDSSLNYLWLFFLLYMFLMGPAVMRRLGPINYLESFLVMGVWTFIAILGDILITANIVGLVAYLTWYFWVGYVTAWLGMFMFHKKIHVVRKKERLKAQGGHGGHH